MYRKVVQIISLNEFDLKREGEREDERKLWRQRMIILAFLGYDKNK